MLAASLLPPSVEHSDANILAAMEKLRYPVLATLKKDGIRAIKLNNLVSRTLKLIPNYSIRARAMKLPAGFDMELWNPELNYDEIESIVMSKEHERSDLIQFHILDWFGELPYQTRYNQAIINIRHYDWKDTEYQYPFPCQDAETLFRTFKIFEQEHGEGICFRTPNSPYKQGRSTIREQYLIKLARYVRQEVTIVGFLEQMENGNSDNYNAVGKMDRSSCQDNLLGKDTLGAFLVRDKNGLDFKVGTGVGLTDALRKEIWNNKAKWIDKQITIKHKPHGMKIKPRSPIYIGLREEGY
jgi:DNA ligase-1